MGCVDVKLNDLLFGFNVSDVFTCGENLSMYCIKDLLGPRHVFGFEKGKI